MRQLKGIKNLHLHLGRHEKEDFKKTDLIIKGPGVKPDSEFLKLAKSRRIPVLTDMGIFFTQCPGRIIGVTGTRGKSTTAFLIWKFLRTKFERVYLAGNIRKSVLELLPKVKKDDWVVLELSSFQLQDLADADIKISGLPRGKPRGALWGKPEIAVFTNLFADHLNWHQTFPNYARAKSLIFKYQNKENYLFINRQDKKVLDLVKGARAKIVSPSLPADFKKIAERNLGTHYLSAVTLAFGVAKTLGVEEEAIKKELLQFKGLEGRQEELMEIKGIHFINDTTSTMPEAALAALERFKNLAQGSRLILIAGGQDKDLDYKKLATEISRKTDVLVLLPGTTTEKIGVELRRQKKELRIIKVESMKGAVKEVWKIAEKGDWVVLSPGAASFGLFQNEFDRGGQFVKEVNKLRKRAEFKLASMFRRQNLRQVLGTTRRSCQSAPRRGVTKKLAKFCLPFG